MKIFEKIFMHKNGNTLIYILLAAGIFLLTAGNALTLLPKKETTEENIHIIEKVSYVSDTEKRLSEILSEIKGAGKTDVMIVSHNNGKKSFGYNTDASRKETVILNKQGEDEALVSEEFTPEIRGVIIVADGGGSTSVKADLINAAKTVLGIAPHKIEVFERIDS